MAYAKQLREQLSTVSTLMNGIVKKAETEGNRGLTNEEATQFDNATTHYDQLEASIARAERAETISNDLSKVSKDQLIELFPADNAKANRELEVSAHAKAFGNYLRHGRTGISAEDAAVLAKFRNATLMSTTTNSQGGYIVPIGFSDKLEVATKWYGGADVCGSFSTETGNILNWPTVNDTTNMGRIIGQNVQMTTTALVFGEVVFSSFIFSSDIVLIPDALMTDSAFDLDGLLANLLGIRMGRLKNNKFTVGVGTTEPLGIVTAAVAAGNTVASGTGATIVFDDLTNLEHAVDPSYRSSPNAKYMFADTTLKGLKKLKDSANRPIWTPQALAGQTLLGNESMINGHPYVINQDMAAVAAGADAVLFGDLSKFMIRKVAGGPVVKRLDERFADSLQVAFLAFDRADSQLLDAGTHPIAILAT
jgi:HK97 family phage major capsid protein